MFLIVTIKKREKKEINRAKLFYVTLRYFKKNTRKTKKGAKMIGSLFVTSLPYFVLLLSLCQVLCGKVYATNESPVAAATPEKKKSNNIELFKTGLITVEFNSTGDTVTQSCNVNDYYSPVVVSAGDVIVALTGVNYTSGNTDNEKNITIVTKYIKIEKKGTDWGSKVVSVGDSNGWKTQYAVSYKPENIQDQTLMVKGMLATAKDDKEIYLLLVNCSSANGGKSNNDAKCELNITMGTVAGETQNGKKITWNSGDINNVDQLTTTLQKEEAKSYLFGGTAFTTANNKVVFVVLIANEKKKNIVAVIYSEGAGTGTKFKVSKVENVDGCIPVFFPWGENKIIMVPTHCTVQGNNQKVKESSDMGSEWSESTGSFARLLGFMQDKNDFTITKVNGSNILLFTQKKLKVTEGASAKNQNDAHVWFSDGNRVHSAGPIVTDDNITSARLLHTKNELFALHQNWDATGQKNITLTRMKEQLDKITRIVVAWNNNDNVVTKLFKDTFAASAANSFTDGLVGFLANRNNGENGKNEWIDEYYYVNATVTGGTKVDSGFKFNGPGSGVKWPVGQLKEEQPYNFTNPGFTLVANVTVDAAAVSDKDNSVLGVVYKENGNGDEKTVGLLCTSEGQWKVTVNKDILKDILSEKDRCQRGSAYLVVFLLKNNKLSVYIDGEEIGKTVSDKMKIEKTHNITHFYFGADASETSQNDIESHVTVRNVLLYNRPFTEEKVEKLKIPKERKVPESSNDSLNDTKNNDERNTQGGNEGIKGSSSDKDVSPSQSSRSGEVEKKSTSQPESSTVRGGYVGLFVCFVILAHALCFL